MKFSTTVWYLSAIAAVSKGIRVDDRVYIYQDDDTRIEINARDFYPNVRVWSWKKGYCALFKA